MCVRSLIYSFAVALPTLLRRLLFDYSWITQKASWPADVRPRSTNKDERRKQVSIRGVIDMDPKH